MPLLDVPLLDEVVLTRVGSAPADRVWQLLATPACWPAWAPHMAHVTGEDPSSAPGAVTVGQSLRIHTVIPGVAVDVRITDVVPGVSWEMVARLPVGWVRSSHRLVEGVDRTGVRLVMRVDGPPLLGAVLLQPYRPLAAVALRRLLHLAAVDGQGAEVARRRRCEA